MPAPAPFPSSQAQQPYPALYLYPINDSFVPKHIALLNNQHVKIGRQTNAKTAPGERNGYFDSKVLSRQHAEVWEEGSKIFIKDVKSSNGTFINGERLSPEGVESQPVELKSDDIVEFGIDIVGEDNKTIIHHKVAARVVCVFNEHDVQVAARAEQHQQQQQQQQQRQQQQQQYHQQGTSSLGQPGTPANGSSNVFNFAGAQQRRTQLAQQGLTGMGGMGGSMRPPGKSGLSFELIFSRLQGELQKSRDTGAELQNLTSSMSDIQDTLGGALPQNIPAPPRTLPPVRPPQPSPPPGEIPPMAMVNGHPEASGQPPPTMPAEALSELQAKLQDTQSSLASHMDKIRVLESVFAEQEALKQEIRGLREMMETHEERLKFELEDYDDDARSIATIVPHELEPVDEEDEENEALEHETQQLSEEAELQVQDLETDEEKHRRREELGRPRTPEPTNLGMGATIHEQVQTSPTHSLGQPLPSVTSQIDERTREISDQVTALSEQVQAILAVKSSLEAQHLAAQATIQALEKKVEVLEAMVKNTQEQSAQVPPPPPAPVTVTPDEPRESLTEMLSEWKRSVQGQWSFVQEEWTHERERLNRAREEFEAKSRQMEVGLEKMSNIQSKNVARFPHANGDVIKPPPNGGYATPSSPRSQSVDSGRYRRGRKRS
ncbi:hypothetical protein AMATHDRAFT_114022, partial [Amanita thiersii Skay4041]